MEKNKSTRGGRREGSGRKPTDRSNVLYVRVNDEAMAIAKMQPNASAFIEKLIQEWSNKLPFE